MKTVMWFRRDLRIQDNKALYYACENLGSDELVLLFQVNPEQFIEDSPNHRAFFSSLQHFKESIDKEAHLQIQYGEPVALFEALKKELPDWHKIYFNEDTSGYGALRDQEAVKFFHENEIESYAYQDAYLHGAKEIKKDGGGYYKVFTPYYKKWLEAVKETPLNVGYQPKLVYKKMLFSKDEEKYKKMIADIPKLELPFGEKAAKDRLTAFLETDLEEYQQARDIPSLDQTSHLSRFLRTGEISMRTVWQKVQDTNKSQSKTTFQKELCWRDFYNMIYTSFPKQKEEPIQDKFKFVEWENDREKFERWQKGETGYPIVDAAMRQLKETGWMHNRLRMIVASFLTKDLLIDWRWGEKYFQQMLIDYDPASNIGGWQWAASTGTDAAPYFRIFNPTIQAEKFDKNGDFIRQYLPKLADLPNKFIHQPEKMTAEQQEEYGVILGEDYPKPIVNHKERRRKALATYESSKEYAQETFDESDG